MNSLQHIRSVFTNSDHFWTPANGSNVSFVCKRCGIGGYLPAKDSKAGIQSNESCNDHILVAVLQD